MSDLYQNMIFIPHHSIRELLVTEWIPQIDPHHRGSLEKTFPRWIFKFTIFVDLQKVEKDAIRYITG